MAEYIREPPARAPEVDAALLVLRGRMAETEDPVEVGEMVAGAGALALDRLGFPPAGPAEITINIGTGEAPDKAQIILTWPLPDPSDGAEPVPGGCDGPGGHRRAGPERGAAA